MVQYFDRIFYLKLKIEAAISMVEIEEYLS
jgi:hypothetical protein